MSNVLYPKGLQNLLEAGLGDLTSVTVKAMAVKTGETYTATDEFMSDVESGRYGGSTDQILGNITTLLGLFDNTANVTWPLLTISGTDHVIAFILYVDTAGVSSTDPLFAWIDTADGSAIDVTPDGRNLVFNPNALGIFQL